MVGWGITLMAIGGLSFILPLLGRQFILVTLFGMTGIGSAVSGVGLLIIGVLLFIAARKKEAAELPAYHTVRQGRYNVQPLQRESLFSEKSDGIVVTEKAFVDANAGDVSAQFFIGAAYLSGSNGLPQDPKKAAHYMGMAANQQHGIACLVMAGLFADGTGVPKNFDYARLWGIKAKELGIADADQMLLAIDSKRST